MGSSKEVSQIDSDLFLHGLGEASLSTAGELKRPYEKAVVHYPEMEDLVWATADHEDLIRSLDGIFQSYQVVIGKRANGRRALERSRFTSQLQKLKGTAYGAVLTQPEGRQGLYTYTEKMLRGYVRMQAEANGIQSKLSALDLPPTYARCIGRFSLFGVAVGYFSMWPGSIRAGNMVDALLHGNEGVYPGAQEARDGNLHVVAQEEANLVCVGRDPIAMPRMLCTFLM
ncbi:hypothetical protein [Variovorax atrisoli]|uniref:hypothetical protein n=1 Tax=Variovorax atrisoli TaxID=3394203 RepID=UPI00404017DE